MRKLLFVALTIHFIVIYCIATVQAQTSIASNSLSALNGSWYRIAVTDDGKPQQNYRVRHFRVYNDGFYSGLGQDSTGAWKVTYAGTYEISDNVWKEKILYC